MTKNADDIEHVKVGTVAWKALRDTFVQAQRGRCAICRGKLNKPQLDHCHDTGFIRGALCGSCNIKLGWYEKRRREIEEYLARSSEFIAYRLPK
ncbi:MAG TPA: endonuclease domain-containing protein [Gemmatimonadaceae bacterium]|nr:endonuclease domain-containing protein [Gemmatimonadaceae bacterium]